LHFASSNRRRPEWQGQLKESFTNPLAEHVDLLMAMPASLLEA